MRERLSRLLTNVKRTALLCCEAMRMELQDILDELRAQYNPDNLAGMVRFGINTDQAYGVPVKTLRWQVNYGN